jgi:hypothetical protein
MTIRRRAIPEQGYWSGIACDASTPYFRQRKPVFTLSTRLSPEGGIIPPPGVSTPGTAQIL